MTKLLITHESCGYIHYRFVYVVYNTEHCIVYFVTVAEVAIFETQCNLLANS